MKSIIIAVLAVAPFSCAKQTPIQVQKPSAQSKSIQVPSSERLGVNKPIASGSALINGKLERVSELSLKSQSDKLLINDNNWDSDWENSVTNQKVVYWSTESHKTVRGNSLQNVDVSEMEGFDFSPVITYMSNALPWEGKTFVQDHFTIPGAAKNTWSTGNQTYYFLPNTFKRNPSSHLPQFDLTFPNYELPKGKISVNNFSMYGRNDREILAKGNSFIFSYNLPQGDRSFYDYDNWLYAAGCPHAYTTNNEGIIAWLDRVDDKVLFNSFKKNFYEKYKNYGYVVMNWEAIGSARSASFWKLQQCFDYWHSQKPNAQLAIWGKGAFGMNRLQIEGNNFEYLFTRALTTKPPMSEYQKPITQENPMAVDEFYANNADVLFVGGYLNYPTNFGYIHHMLIQYMMNKKYFPNKKSVLSWWSQQEYVGDFERSKVFFKDAKGRTQYTVTKPMLFPDAMHNAAVWAHAFCDGGDLWSVPYSRMDDPTYLGPSTEVFDLNGRKIESTFKPNSNAQYAIQDYSNIDRWEGGKWAVSQCKDIIDASTDWNFAAGTKGSQEFDSTLPSYSLYQKTPLLAYKLSEDGSEAVILAYDAWNNPLKQEKLTIIISGKAYELTVYGRYTSVIRQKLS